MAKHLTVPGVIAAFLLKWVADEAKAWLPWCARRFFDLSVRLLPRSERERYSEEWRGHIESLPGTGLASAHFVWAALEIRALGAKEVLLQTWMRFRIRTALFGLFVYCWLSSRMARILGTERPIVHGHSAESSNLTVLILAVIAFAWLQQSSKSRPTATP